MIAAKRKKRPTRPTPVAQFRDRVRNVGRIVRDAFGLDLQYTEACGAQDAYRVVIARIVETLINDDGEIATGQLATLSKVLAEQRRLDIAQLEVERRFPQEMPQRDTPATNGEKEMPPRVKTAVRDAYGTNLTEAGEADIEPRLDDDGR